MEIFESIIGKVFGDMQVIELSHITPNFVKVYKVKCKICGHEKEIQFSRLKSLTNCFHSNEGCGVYLKEWQDFCKWIETLPYAKELICGE